MISYLVVIAISCLVGVTELVSRYRDRPATLLRVPGTWVYVAINGSAGAGSLYLIHAFGWEVGAKSSTAAGATAEVLVAAFGSMLVFRSALFTVRVGDEDIAVGPSTLLSSLLSAADRGVDRMQAKQRSVVVARIMSEVSFERARLALPTYVLGLLQNVSAEDQADLRTAVDALAASDMTDTQKSLNLGLLLMNVAGPEVVQSAVDSLRDSIQRGPGDQGGDTQIPPQRAELTG